MKHSPHPWTFHETPEGEHAGIIMSGDDVIAYIPRILRKGDSSHNGNKQNLRKKAAANGKLMAMAPELEQSLFRLCLWIVQNGYESQVPEYIFNDACRLVDGGFDHEEIHT
jgi:hypothetical protein